MKKTDLFKWINKNLLKPASLGVLALSLIIFLGLFINPILGMGNNGNLKSIMTGSGLYTLDDLTSEEEKGYFHKDLGIMEYQEDGGKITSQTFFINLGKILDLLFTRDAIFDFRFYGGVITFFFLGVMYLLFEGITFGKRNLPAYLIVALGVFIFGDSTYTLWFNSLYKESIVYFSCIMAMVPMLLMAQKRYNDYLLMGIFLVNAVVLGLSSEENGLIGVLLGTLGMAIFLINPTKRFKNFCVFGGGLVIFISMLGLFFIPEDKNEFAGYHAMTQGIMLTATNPEEALDFFGIDPQFAVLTNAAYFNDIPWSVLNSEFMKEAFFDKFSSSQMMSYYLFHPGQLYTMMDQSVNNSFNVRPSGIGNFEMSFGKALGAQTDYFTTWSSIKTHVLPGRIGFIIIFLAIIIGVKGTQFNKLRREEKYRNSLEFVAFLVWIVLGFTQMYLSIINYGNQEIAGHLFIFATIFDLLLYMMLGSLIFWLWKRYHKEVKL